MSTNVSIFRASEAVFASTPTGPTRVNVPMAGRARTVNLVSVRSYKKKSPHVILTLQNDENFTCIIAYRKFMNHKNSSL